MVVDGEIGGCPEEVAFVRGFITAEQLRLVAAKCDKTGYGRHLLRVAEEPGSATSAR